MESNTLQRFLFESLISICNKVFDRFEERTCQKHGLSKHLLKFERRFERIVNTPLFQGAVRKFAMRNRANATLADAEWLDSNVSFVYEDFQIPISGAYTTALQIKSDSEAETQSIPAAMRTIQEETLMPDSLQLVVLAIIYLGVPASDETRPRIENIIRQLKERLPAPLCEAILSKDFVFNTSQSVVSSSNGSSSSSSSASASAANPLSSILSSLMGTVANAAGGGGGGASAGGAAAGESMPLPDASQMSGMLSSIFNNPATQNIIGSLLNEVKTCRRPEDVVQKGFQIFSDPKVIDSISKIKLEVPPAGAPAEASAASAAGTAAGGAASIANMFSPELISKIASSAAPFANLGGNAEASASAGQEDVD